MLVVWKLDRLRRSLFHLIEIMEKLAERGGGIHSPTEVIDTTAGDRFFYIMQLAVPLRRVSER